MAYVKLAWGVSVQGVILTKKSSDFAQKLNLLVGLSYFSSAESGKNWLSRI